MEGRRRQSFPLKNTTNAIELSKQGTCMSSRKITEIVSWCKEYIAVIITTTQKPKQTIRLYRNLCKIK